MQHKKIPHHVEATSFLYNLLNLNLEVYVSDISIHPTIRMDKDVDVLEVDVSGLVRSGINTI